jgi:hypothetical protein
MRKWGRCVCGVVGSLGCRRQAFQKAKSLPLPFFEMPTLFSAQKIPIVGYHGKEKFNLQGCGLTMFQGITLHLRSGHIISSLS